MTIRGAVLDVDGTLLRGDEPLPGVRTGLAALRDAGATPLFFSNNPTKAPPAYRERLRTAGIDPGDGEVITSGTTTVAYLREHHSDDRLFVVGESGLRTQLSAADLELVADPDAAEVVVASIDREFTYDHLRDALWALSDDDVAFVGTDPDVVIPASERPVPGSGAVINAVAAVAEREPDAVLGKPSPTARRIVRQRLDLPPEHCLVVGDRLDTDVALGERAGMTTALVLTGVTDESDLVDAEVSPDYVLDSLADVGDVLADR
ncbi:MAG: HAD-IIA family hydrolase [Haloferacaceae archaeon]